MQFKLVALFMNQIKPLMNDWFQSYYWKERINKVLMVVVAECSHRLTWIINIPTLITRSALFLNWDYIMHAVLYPTKQLIDCCFGLWTLIIFVQILFIRKCIFIGPGLQKCGNRGNLGNPVPIQNSIWLGKMA